LADFARMYCTKCGSELAVGAAACPACGAGLTARFDPVAYTLAELRDAFAGIYQETHALASGYGWQEEVILRLPRARRQRYCAMIIDERSLP